MAATKKRELREQFAVILEREGVDVALRADMLDELVNVVDTTLRRRVHTADGIEHEAMVAVLVNVCQRDRSGQIDRAAKMLAEAGHEPQAIMRDFAPSGWYYCVYRAWIVKRGEHVAAPSPQQVVDLARQARDYHDKTANPARYYSGAYADIIEH